MEKSSLKVVIIGSSGAGKSSIIERICKNKFSYETTTTIGASFGTYKLNKEKCEITLNIWDVAGQERFRSLLPLYSDKANAIIIVYDITESKSFETSKSLYYEIIEKSITKPIIILVGNKCDLNEKREVEKKKGEDFAKYEKIYFLETSAKTSKNIRNIFEMIINNLDENLQKDIEEVVYNMSSYFNCCTIS